MFKTSGDHLLIQGSPRLSIDISGIVRRKTAVACSTQGLCKSVPQKPSRPQARVQRPRPMPDIARFGRRWTDGQTCEDAGGPQALSRKGPPYRRTRGGAHAVSCPSASKAQIKTPRSEALAGREAFRYKCDMRLRVHTSTITPLVVHRRLFETHEVVLQECHEALHVAELLRPRVESSAPLVI